MVLEIISCLYGSGYMLDYIAPKKVMSWKEAFEMYIEDQVLNGLFKDLEAYGIRKPLYYEQAIAEKEHIRIIAALVLYRVPMCLLPSFCTYG